MLEKEFVKERLAERLIEARESHDLSQEAVARQIDVGSRTYQRWEKREAVPNSRNRRKIKEALAIDLEDLFPKEGPPNGVIDLLRSMNGKLDQLLGNGRSKK